MMIVDNQYPNDNYYELKYKSGDYEVVVKFNSMLAGDTLTENLRDFLASCSWRDNQIKDILRVDDEGYYEHIEEEEDE